MSLNTQMMRALVASLSLSALALAFAIQAKPLPNADLAQGKHEASSPREPSALTLVVIETPAPATGRAQWRAQLPAMMVSRRSRSS